MASNSEETQQESMCPHQAAAAAATTKKRPPGGSISDDPQLPKREIAFYLVALVSIITYAGYGFYLTYGQDLTKNLPVILMKKGWMRDYMDGDEEQLIDRAIHNGKFLVSATLAYLIVSKATLQWTPFACHHIACAAFTLFMTASLISYETVLLLVTLHTAVLCLSYFSSVAVWLFLGAILCLQNVGSIFMSVYNGLKLNHDNAIIFAAMFGYLLCRLISLGHSLQRCRQRQLEQSGSAAPSFLEHIGTNLPLSLHYTFYMPYHWCGPILTYEQFREQVEIRGRKVAIDKSTAVCVAWRCCRMMLWFFVLQAIYHYLPVAAYLAYLDPESHITYKHLAFAMFMRGQNFMLEYVQLYGWPAALAKLDGVQLFHWPDCISWIYSYSIMWRVFDRGLFAFMQAHIYVPLGGSRHGFARQILAALACFAFICVFHGDSTSVRAWVALNAGQLIVEKVVAVIYRNYIRGAITKHLSPQNEKRLVGYVISWNMMVSCGIIFFFLAEPNGFIIMPEFLLLRSANRHTPIWHMLTMQFAAYCAVQIGRFYESKAAALSCKAKPH